MSEMDVTVLTEQEIRALIGPDEALPAAREAFAQLARGQATLPAVLFLDLPENEGEVHVKGAYLHGSPFFAVKAASGFYRNPERGLPVTAGAVWVFDASTGRPAYILFDNGFLTELRTGAAGAVAAEALSRLNSRRVAVLGCGGQARYQLEALVNVRPIEGVSVYCRTPHAGERLQRDLAHLGPAIDTVTAAEAAVEGADIVVTVTPARGPIFRAGWLRPGMHITAVGSDVPAKQELEVEALGRADKVVADRLSQCLEQGEIHHAVAAGVLAPEDVHAELGEIVAGLKPGRERDDEITVADLTGVGVLDAAMASLVAERAAERKLGTALKV
jgi:ornithine cyclodeaminase